MHDKEKLITLQDFMSEDYKSIFSKNRFMQDHFSDICQKYIDYGMEILEDKPFESLKIYNLLNRFHEVLGFMPHGILPFSENIVVQIASDDIDKAIELVDIIEIECFKTNALFKIAEKTSDSKLINKIAKKISLYGDVEDIMNFYKLHNIRLKISLTEMLSNKKNKRINE